MPARVAVPAAAFVAAACRQALEATPGVTVHYSAITAHALLAEVVRRLDGGTRPFRDILAEDVLNPLGMRDTALGLRADLAKRNVPVVVRDRSDGIFDPDLLEAFNVLVTEDTACCYMEGYQSVLRITRGETVVLEEIYEGATGPHLLTELELDEGIYIVANWHVPSSGGGFGGGTDAPMDECSTEAEIVGGATVELLFSHPLTEACSVTAA